MFLIFGKLRDTVELSRILTSVVAKMLVVGLPEGVCEHHDVCQLAPVIQAALFLLYKAEMIYQCIMGVPEYKIYNPESQPGVQSKFERSGTS
ncbi:hypothetical protein GDO81_019479 [Engystomops pustulosus]|uniref:Uncharacterized protein n=1 Tax=Engystomops pustulosus TaxID=76066 RepID=A0AAV6YHL8_ENGPU|nr:hypothetical protein GDO81_019479 [Engystomops pustulosus]